MLDNTTTSTTSQFDNDKFDKLPSTPPKAHFAAHDKKVACDGVRPVSAASSSIAADRNQRDTETNPQEKDDMAAKLPWWRRYAGYNKLRSPRSRFRRRLILSTILLFVAFVAIIAWLFDSGRIGGKTFAISVSTPPTFLWPPNLFITKDQAASVRCTTSRNPIAIDHYA
jgi:hypothetical protein